jgi:5'-nucleotidase
MRILLTNDDGWFADGLQALAKLLLHEQHEVAIVAPNVERSNCGHQASARGAIQVQRIENAIATIPTWSVDGWPADCVRIAIGHLKLSPDCILSGINHGGNLGVDIPMSGTCAAAREASYFGYPSIAISQVRKSNVVTDWKVSAALAWKISQSLLEQPFPRVGFWNVNLPACDLSTIDVTAMQCPIDTSPLHVEYTPNGDVLEMKSDYHQRPRSPGTDVDICFRGRPTVSFVPISGELKHA